MNSEEKETITKLCYRFKDIFYDEQQNFTFATDESPIYCKISGTPIT